MGLIPLGRVGSKSLGEYFPDEGTPVNAVAAQGILTVAVQPTAADTMTIGSTTYTFVANDATGLTAGEVKIGADLAGAKTNIIAALKGTDSINTANAEVTPADTFSTNDLTLTASIAGTSGNSIATTETFDSGSNVFDAATLGTERAGVDGTVGRKGYLRFDDSYLYIALDKNTIADANWRRVSLGSAY